MSIDQDLFRRVAGSFASGVTVVTTGREGAYHGLTATAFSSLSLNPPQVLVCIDRDAEALPHLQAAGAFTVNLLDAGQEEVSRLFARRESAERHNLEGLDFVVGTTGVARLAHSLGYFECRTAQEYDGGDHIIFVGRVESAGLGDGESPLVYFRGSYRALASL